MAQANTFIGVAALLTALATSSPARAADAAADPAAPTPREQAVVVTPVLDEPGILTGRGWWVVEPSLQFSNSSSHRVLIQGYTFYDALVVGSIDVRSVNRDALVAAVAARYGITNRWEAEFKVPYVYRSDATTTRPLSGSGSTADAVFEADGDGIGDVELALRYQLRNNVGKPFVVGALRIKTRTGKDPFEVELDPDTQLERELPTGSGFYGVQPSLTLIHVSDPAVFSVSMNYLWYLERDVGGDVGEIDPGDMFGLTLGMGLALNEKASFSLGYDHNVVGKTKQNGTALPTAMTTHVSSLLFGLGYRLDPRRSLNLSIATGVTEAAPDAQITLRMPILF
jgi:hypothetical protein